MTADAMSPDIQTRLQHLYRRWAGHAPDRIVSIPADGSTRRYFRIYGDASSVIGAFNPNRKENIAFLTLSRHFKRHGLPVPEIYIDDLDHGVYLQQDLGDATLFSMLTAIRAQEGFSDRLTGIYRRVLDALPRFQIVAGRDLDYSVCYPRSRFDAQSIRWDLNYFKYNFLKLADIPFDEQDLETDFDTLTGFLMQADGDYFLYRDFQSRNVMWFEDSPHFIDYQGGRRGALQYDVASLLMDGKADLPWPARDDLLAHYMETARGYVPLRSDAFLPHYYGYAFVRVMQAFGTYGLRGLHEGKPHFIQSIPFGLRNLEGLMARARLPVDLPECHRVWRRMIDSEALQRMGRTPEPGLTVHIRSFSYRGGLPRDETGHGGGFVFDCRALPNPGRRAEFASLTGRDAPVIEYLEQEDGVARFLDQAFMLVDQAVAHHLGRGFTDLTVAFGCTGGQHRSVYCAERLAAHLRERQGVAVDLRHREQSIAP